MAIKNRLKEIRMRDYLETQKEFSIRLGLLQSTYNQLESAKRLPSLEVALNICKTLGLQVENIWCLE